MSSCGSYSDYESAHPCDGSRRHELVVFEEEDFSPESYVFGRLRPVEEEKETPWKSAVYRNFCACVKQPEVHYRDTNTKNELRVMIAELKGLQQISAKEMIKSMISQYALFIQTSREVADLEEAILKLRTLLCSRAAVIRSLATTEWTEPVTHPQISTGCSDSGDDDSILSNPEDTARSLPDVLDVLFAERNVNLFLSSLEEGEKMVEGDLSPVTASFLRIALAERRARLVSYLSEVCRQPSVQGVELRGAIGMLNRLGEGTRAHTLLLLAHHERLKHNTRGRRPSGTSYGGAFTAALSQMTFSAIAQAERDSLAVFGAVPAYASELVVWARDVTEVYAGQIKQHVLSSAAAAGGLQAAAECVQIAFGYCSLLESQGLTMCPLLAKVFRSSVEQAMEANLRRIEESVTALASADDWTLTIHQSVNSSRSLGRRSVKLSCSAHRFSSMAQDFMAGVSPLVSMQLAGVALEGLALRFHNYVDMLIRAVPDTTKIREQQSTARSEARQLALLSNATALALELLPCSASRLLLSGKEEESSFILPGLKDWQQKLRMGVKRLQDHVCKYNVHLVLDSVNMPQLTPAAYLALDEEDDGSNAASSFQQDDNMPSLVFQALSDKLTSIMAVGEEMAFNCERVVTPFLARFVEVFVSYMDEDHFWSIIEDGPQRIGPIGLKKFVMDMQFVVQLASSNGCGSRSLSAVVPHLTSRAVHAFAATGADPESVLPSDDWFLEAAHKAIEHLTQKWNQMSDDHDAAATFPTEEAEAAYEE